VQLIPVSDSLFREPKDPEATLVFTKTSDGVAVMAGATRYAERRLRWPVELIRWTVLLSAGIVLTPLLVLVIWIAYAKQSAFWVLKGFLLLCAIAFLLPVIGILNVNDRSLGTQNLWTMAIFAGSVLMPFAAIVSLLLVVDAWRRGAARGLRLYGLTVSASALVISGYLSAWGMIGLMPWSF
jgi:hypothetical protein